MQKGGVKVTITPAQPKIILQNLLSLLGLQSEPHPQENVCDPRLAITCMKMDAAQNAAAIVHEQLQSMTLHTTVDAAAFQRTLTDYAAFMEYAARLKTPLEQAGVQESAYRPMLDRCYAASPARDILEAAVLKEVEADMARLPSAGTWAERVRPEKTRPPMVAADGRAA
jgi:hypothetical protein